MSPPCPARGGARHATLDDERLPAVARDIIGDRENAILVSAVSAWEVAIRFRIGKLPGAEAVARDMATCLRSQGFSAIPVTLAEAQRAGLLPGPHRDPFDRMLMAQTLVLGVPLISNEVIFDQYGVERIW